METKYDFDEYFPMICRICLKFDQQLEPIYGYDNTSSVISDMICYLSALKIDEQEETELPKVICNPCLKTLIACDLLRKQILTSYEQLTKYIQLKKTSIRFNNLDTQNCVTQSRNEISECMNASEFTLNQQIVTIIHNNSNNNSNNNNYNSNNNNSTNNTIKIENSLGETNKISKKITRNMKIIKKKEKIRKPRKRSYPSGVCHICGVYRKNLPCHMVCHEEKVPHPCVVCHKTFTNIYNLREHIKAIHINERNFKCDICTQAFNKKYLLQKHMLTHSSERKFKCNYCDKRFRMAATRDDHHIIHTQERQFQCEFCNKTFARKNTLRNHVGIHTGERPFLCGFCPMQFINSSSAAVHRRIHKKDSVTPYRCSICQMEFAFRNMYNAHVRKHEIESLSMEMITKS